MKLKAPHLAAAIIFALPAYASVATPPTTDKAKANLVEYGSIENLELSQLVDGIDDGALNSEAITAAYLSRIAAIDDANGSAEQASNWPQLYRPQMA